MRGLSSILSVLWNEFNKCIIHEYEYYMTLELFMIAVFV